MKSSVFVFLFFCAVLCRAGEPLLPPPVEQPFPKPSTLTPPPPALEPSKPGLPEVDPKIGPPPVLGATVPDASRLEHGRSQVRQLFSDRYLMGAYRTAKGEVHKVTENDAIFQWLSRKFAGEDTGEILFWDSEPPKDFRAVHAGPSQHWLGFVQISRFTPADEGRPGRILSFEELWACATFEMLSMGRTQEWNHIQDKAAGGLISKEDFVEAGAKFEFQSLEASGGFYEKVWLPWANTVGFESDKRFWGIPPSYEEWRSHYADHAKYPWKPFEEIYDELRKHGRD